MPIAAFGPGFPGKILSRLLDEEWWADNLLIFAVFSGLTTWLVSLAQKDIDRRWRRRFDDWRMELVEGGEVQIAADLYWEDAEKYLHSEFERWRAIKGLMSTQWEVNCPSIEEARARGWLEDPMARLRGECPPVDG